MCRPNTNFFLVRSRTVRKSHTVLVQRARLRPRDAHAVDRALAAFHVVGGDLEGRVLDEFAHALRASPLNLAEGFSMGPLALASTLVKVAARPLAVLQSFRLLGLHKHIVFDRATRAIPAAAEPLSRLT